MTTSEQITVFVCGPWLVGEVLDRITVRHGAVVWEGGTEPAPQPAELIRQIHHLPVKERLVLVVTDQAMYLTTVDDLANQAALSRTCPLWNVHQYPLEARDASERSQTQRTTTTPSV